MNFLKTLCALTLLSTTAGIVALKVLPGSPIYICTNKGFKQGTPEFDKCVKQEQIAQQLKLSRYQMQYGPDTGIVPPQHRTQYDGPDTGIVPPQHRTQYGSNTGIVPPQLQQNQ